MKRKISFHSCIYFKLLLILPLLFCAQNGKAEAAETQVIGDPKGTNFPMDAEGRVYHLGLKRGEVANRILLVGDPERAKLIRESLDNPKETFHYVSNRGFTTYTGTKNGKPISIMAIGMGMPMMDFAIREIRAITDGPLYVIRLGSCGTPRSDISIGTVVVANQSYGILTDYDAYHITDPSLSSLACFKLTKPLQPDLALHKKLVTSLTNALESFPVVEATDATADTFYGSQGRLDPSFDDRNASLIDQILEQHPDTASLQMETFHLYHLAKLNEYAKQKMIHVAACAIVLAQRKSDDFLSNEVKHLIEKKAGNACLEALAECEILE